MANVTGVHLFWVVVIIFAIGAFISEDRRETRRKDCVEKTYATCIADGGNQCDVVVKNMCKAGYSW